MERGIVYGVSHLPYLKETIYSAKSAKLHMPDIPTELHIDQETISQIPEHINLNNYTTLYLFFERKPKLKQQHSENNNNYNNGTLITICS